MDDFLHLTCEYNHHLLLNNTNTWFTSMLLTRPSWKEQSCRLLVQTWRYLHQWHGNTLLTQEVHLRESERINYSFTWLVDRLILFISLTFCLAQMHRFSCWPGSAVSHSSSSCSDSNSSPPVLTEEHRYVYSCQISSSTQQCVDSGVPQGSVFSWFWSMIWLTCSITCSLLLFTILFLLSVSSLTSCLCLSAQSWLVL